MFLSFNSIMVRLKARVAGQIFARTERFNSIMVRLKAVATGKKKHAFTGLSASKDRCFFMIMSSTFNTLISPEPRRHV